MKGAGGVIQIFSRKGHVWALYMHWSPKWNVLTSNDMIHNYDMVEVLGNCTEKEGVTVISLVKVAASRRYSISIWTLISSYSKERDVSLSYQVPSYLLIGQKVPNAPIGCWELDPAALPLELFFFFELGNLYYITKVHTNALLRCALTLYTNALQTPLLYFYIEL